MYVIASLCTWGYVSMSSFLIVVFDGLQPSQVVPELMPNLSRFADEGVFFAWNHSIFPSVTRLNAATMVTGRLSGGHGLAGNQLVARDYDSNRVLDAMEPDLARLADATGKVLLAPTLADILSTHGQEYTAIGVGTSGNAYVHNPTADVAGGATIHPEFTLPGSLHEHLASRFGPWPAEDRPNTPRFVHALRIMKEHILSERGPTVALAWSSEPDKSQHSAGVGSELANRALREADAEFGGLLAWLQETGRERDTNMFVLSDHGYSTITGATDLNSQLRSAGFPPGNEQGGVLVAEQGGSALFYVHESDLGTTDRLAQWLMQQPWCGALLASDSAGGVQGTLPASLAGVDGPRAPELAMAFRWEDRANDLGYPGHAPSTSGGEGLGQHGGMSRHEMRNTLIARGPAFKSGVKLESPSGNVDMAPTILHVLGFSGGEAMDGRILHEALSAGPDRIDWTTAEYNAEREFAAGTYRQRIGVSVAGGSAYVDEGNSTFE